MSRYENAQEQSDEPKGQDFSALGYDAAMARQLASDLQLPVPERYERAAQWATDILSAAQAVVPRHVSGIMSGSDIDEPYEITTPGELCGVQLNDYLSRQVVGTLPQDSAEQKVVSEFVGAMTDSVVAPDERIGVCGVDGGFTSYNSHMFVYDPEQVGDYVGRMLEYTPLQETASANGRALRKHAAAMTSTELAEAGVLLKDMTKRIHGLVYEQQYWPETTVDSQRNEPDDWEWSADSETVTFDSIPIIKQPYGNGYTYPLPEVARLAVASGKLQQRVQGIVAEIDPVRTDVGRYGAKGANLLKMQTVLEGLRPGEDDALARVSIPSFTIVETDAFRVWRDSGSVDIATEAVLEWMRTQEHDGRYLARSSAVYSEDGEHMGAGIYESVIINASTSPEEIANALVRVYESVDSPAALAYRQEVGVDSEEMAVVVQQEAEYRDPDGGYVTYNTQTPHQPNLSDYKIQRGSHPLDAAASRYASEHSLPFDRNGVALEFGSTFTQREISAPRFHVPPDTRFHRVWNTWAASQAAMLGEVVLGGPVQAEMVVEAGRAHLVQVRPLPPAMLEPVSFSGFPADKEPWFVGRSVGVLDGVEATVLQVSEPGIVREELEWEQGNLLIDVPGSHGMSGVADGLRSLMMGMSPEQRSRVIIHVPLPPRYGSDVSGMGHLETMAAELGVSLICYDPGSKYQKGFEPRQKVTIYSDGYQGRIYTEPDSLWDIDAGQAERMAWELAESERELTGSEALLNEKYES